MFFCFCFYFTLFFLVWFSLDMPVTYCTVQNLKTLAYHQYAGLSTPLLWFPTFVYISQLQIPLKGFCSVKEVSGHTHVTWQMAVVGCKIVYFMRRRIYYFFVKLILFFALGKKPRLWKDTEKKTKDQGTHEIWLDTINSRHSPLQGRNRLILARRMVINVLTTSARLDNKSFWIS